VSAREIHLPIQGGQEFESLRARQIATIQNKTANILVRSLFPGNNRLQDILATDDSDRFFIDFKGADERTDISAPRINVTVVEFVISRENVSISSGSIDNR
jgi:hypothetical protein